MQKQHSSAAVWGKAGRALPTASLCSPMASPALAPLKFPTKHPWIAFAFPLAWLPSWEGFRGSFCDPLHDLILHLPFKLFSSFGTKLANLKNTPSRSKLCTPQLDKSTMQNFVHWYFSNRFGLNIPPSKAEEHCKGEGLAWTGGILSTQSFLPFYSI